MPLAIGPVHLRGKTSPTVSVGIFADGDLALSQGKDSVMMDADQQGQFFAWASKQDHLSRFFQPSSQE